MIDYNSLSLGLKNVKNVILILSGKGGVGKSTVTVEIALNLWKLGLKVGVLDIDICGPSIPRMLGLSKKEIHQCNKGWLPVIADSPEGRFKVVSIDSLMVDNKDCAIIWRGARKSGMIAQFMGTAVCWNELDVLLIDTPPGTSDEHISAIEWTKNSPQFGDKLTGAIIVTTPQRVSIADVRKEINFCDVNSVKIIGLIENMSGYLCKHCNECNYIFSHGGGEHLANEKGIHFLGRIPIDSRLIEIIDADLPFKDKASYESEEFALISKYLYEKYLSNTT